MHIERIEPGTKEWNLYYANHISRYMFALEQIRDKEFTNVLDVACGVGYGTNYLANSGFDLVVGVDISEEALAIARKNFKKDNVEFVKDDCNYLKEVNQRKFDAIISFETLEHLKNYDSFVKQLHNMLEQEGVLNISTPNILVTEHHSKDDWHFHEKEFNPKEFYDLLESAGFTKIDFYGQSLSSIGKLRSDIRHEINILRSNPFSRIGMWLQSKLKGRKFDYPLPEKIEDFEIKKYSVEECMQLDKNGPFVLIAVCQKK